MRKREKDKLEKTLGGVRNMSRVPSAVWIVDTKKEHLAVKEARKLGIPVIAILDTNCDPDEVDFPIPGNDDAIRAVTLLTRVVADGVADGLMSRAAQRTGDEAGPGDELATDEPLAEWEKELLAGSAEAIEAPAETPDGAAAETPADTATEAPADTATETPADTATEAPADTATEAPVDTATETPADAQADETVDTPAAEEAPVAEAAEVTGDAAETTEKA